MAVGDFRQIGHFENPGGGPDGEGGWIEGWAPIDPPDWAVSLEPATARDLERVASGAVIATATHIIRGRYHPAVTTASRMRFMDTSLGAAARERIFQIRGIRNLEERDVIMEIVAEEQLP